MTDKQKISTGFGKVTFPTTSMSLYTHAVFPPFRKVFASKHYGGRAAQTSAIAVSAHPETDGTLFISNFDIEDGALLCLQSRKTFRGSPVCDAALFLRTRKDGPGLLIRAKVPPDQRCVLSANEHIAFTGRGDILTIEEVRDTGIVVPPHFHKAYMNQDEVREMFTIEEVTPALAGKPITETHTTTEGEKVVLKVAQNTRRIRIRRDI